MHGHGGGHGHGGHGHGPQPIHIHLLPWHWITNLIKLVIVGLVGLSLWAWLGTWGLLLLIFGPGLIYGAVIGAREAHKEAQATGGYMWQKKWTPGDRLIFYFGIGYLLLLISIRVWL